MRKIRTSQERCRQAFSQDQDSVAQQCELGQFRRDQHNSEALFRELLNQAIASQTVAVELDPDELQYKRFLRNHYSNLGECLKSEDAEQADAAIEACETSVQWAEDVVRDRPDAAGDLRKLANCYAQLLAHLIDSPDRAGEALIWAEKMAEVYQQLADAYPAVTWYRHRLGDKRQAQS